MNDNISNERVLILKQCAHLSLQLQNMQKELATLIEANNLTPEEIEKAKTDLGAYYQNTFLSGSKFNNSADISST